MIIYRVKITMEAGIETEWVNWMKQVHVPDVVRTGCFSECRMFRVLDPDATEPSYVMEYQAPSLETYYRYRDQFAPALQKEHSDRFGGRCRGAREILEEIARV